MLTSGDAAAICEALRRGVTTLPRIHEALELLPGSRGNPLRRHLLEAARDNPWSPLELEAHILLRKAGIGGWVTNHRVRAGTTTYYLDIAFPLRHLGLELDGWRHHGNHTSFVTDRIRQNQLALAGWTILRFTAHSMDMLVPEIRRALGFASRAPESH